MEIQSNPNEMSHTSHKGNETSNKHESPQSIDSAVAREIRGKPFVHSKKPGNNRHLPQSAPNNQNNKYREHYNKWNSRHVNLLDHRS